MVKVLQRGTKRAVGDGPVVASCARCNSLFEFEQREAIREPDRLDGDALVIDCPVCRAEQWIPVPRRGEE